MYTNSTLEAIERQFATNWQARQNPPVKFAPVPQQEPIPVSPTVRERWLAHFAALVPTAIDAVAAMCLIGSLLVALIGG